MLPCGVKALLGNHRRRARSPLTVTQADAAGRPGSLDAYDFHTLLLRSSARAKQPSRTTDLVAENLLLSRQNIPRRTERLSETPSGQRSDERPVRKRLCPFPPEECRIVATLLGASQRKNMV